MRIQTEDSDIEFNESEILVWIGLGALLLFGSKLKKKEDVIVPVVTDRTKYEHDISPVDEYIDYVEHPRK